MRNLFFLSVLLLCFSSCFKCRESCVHGQCIKRMCECDLWYGGDRCNRSVLSNFEGKYEGESECASFSDKLVFQLTVDSLYPQRLWLNEDGFYLEFATNNAFKIPNQVIEGERMRGEGQMLANGISFFLMPESDSTAVGCLTQAHRTQETLDE